MTMPRDMQDILTRLRETTEGSRELDFSVDLLMRPEHYAPIVHERGLGFPVSWCDADELSPVTTSADAALALVAARLPGWFWRGGHVPGGKWDHGRQRHGWAHLSRTDASNCDHGDEFTGWADTVPLALCIALLEAVTAQDPAP